MQCIDCNGEMNGDGYTSVMKCENLPESVDTSFMAPDEGPVYCELECDSVDSVDSGAASHMITQ